MDLRWNEDANTHLIAFCSTRQAPKVNKAASAKNIIFEKIELDFTWELNLLRSYRISKTEDHSKHMCTFQTTSTKQKKFNDEFIIFFFSTWMEYLMICNIHHRNVFLLSIVRQFEYLILLPRRSIPNTIRLPLIFFHEYPTFPASSNACLSYKINFKRPIKFSQTLTLFAKPVSKYVWKNPAIMINGINAKISNVNAHP